MAASPPPTPYPLDSAHATAPAHLGGLAEMLDPFTLSRLRDRNPLYGARVMLYGARVLEVGAGHGHLALTLADQVGPSGQVVALDLKPAAVNHPRLRFIAHDLNSPGPIPTEPCDIIHARLVLGHLPQREAILDRLLAVARPGALVLIEDWEPVRHGVVVAAPDAQAADLYYAYALAAGNVFDTAGTDPGWARRIHTALTRRGLRYVDTIIRGQYWTGGSVGCRTIAATLPQLRDRLLRQGLTEQQCDALPGLLADPRLVVHSHMLYSTAGFVA